MKVAVDLKNLALYSGGISQWFSPLLRSWIAYGEKYFPENLKFVLVIPISKELKIPDFPIGKNSNYYRYSWPGFLKRQFAHVFYDNFIFPWLISHIKPQCVITPYHDVLLPKKTNSNIAVITVHDLCFKDVPNAYPWLIRTYYWWMLRRNIARAHHILTVSETTKKHLIKEFRVSPNEISVVPNSLPSEFLKSSYETVSINEWRNKHGLYGSCIALYTSGVEYRKNVVRLLEAFRKLWSQGEKINLCITGNLDSRWSHLFTLDELNSGRIQFLGFLTLSELRLAYESAHVVVYPSLCEGFGRACLEAKTCGTPLACSDIEVFHEVAEDYPVYFDPYDIDSIVTAIKLATEKNRNSFFEDPRYSSQEIEQKFIKIMNGLIGIDDKKSVREH